MWSITAALLLSARLVLAAINIDGSQAVEPAYENDFSPISDISTYQIDQHECPLPCVDYSNPHSWIPYSSVGRLKRCQQPMLLQFSVSQPLSDPQSNIIIRSCTLNPAEHGSIMASAAEAASIVENPKKLDESAKYGGLESTSVACSTSGMQLPGKIEVVTSTRKTPNSSDAVDLLKGMRQFFAAKDNCDEKFLFGYHNQFVAGVYIGEHITKSTADSALAALSKQLQSDNSVPDQAIVQYYDNGRQPDSIFGIFIDNNRNLSAVQQTILGWSQGNYANGVLGSKGVQSGAKLFGVVQHNGTSSGNGTSLTSNLISRLLRTQIRPVNRADKRAVCRSVQVVEHDTCAILAERCGITPYAFSKFNSKPNFCSTLQPRDTACCSSGSVPKPDSPQAGPDGSCASHLIRNGDSCFAVSKKYGVTVEDLEKWNKGKTWAWTECKDMLVGYSMCVSKGTPPMPPPQMGTQCGPLVPGTKPPTNSSVSLADLNPCPLKACCSNWGFCGVFPGHCAINAPEGGGPGTKKKGFQSTCISNCETKIKQNSGPPVSFQRIGYYESFNLERECLWLKAKNANTDGTYTHIHWGFASIDPNTWMPVVNNTKNQWSSFKELTGVKKILSFGGWAYSTEPATYNIIRSAIIDNRNTFAANLAKFAKDEGFDGIDIDWEYPGAPDILVGGKPIGQKRDGIDYLKFLTVLKKQLGPEKSVSIAAPASFWYLQAFPIDRIAAVVDYIVYMTYDLHGQWDYGNVNAFDSCASGKCIRSHVNLTETSNALAMITKAGVPNNKIFVGESSYGRTFHMASNGCWGPTCDFTGSRTQSDAKPGRCTKTGGYIAYAEILEILKKGDDVKVFHDGDSNTDVMLYEGDYVSYMTPTTKDTRREDWKKLNFAGSIDWAVDLQSFTAEDWDIPPERSDSGVGCVEGRDMTTNTGDLCEFACGYGFCPRTLCDCVQSGKLPPLPKEVPDVNIVAIDVLDVDLNRLCKFSCKYGFCPPDLCVPPEPEDDGVVQIGEQDSYFNYTDARWEAAHHCLFYKGAKFSDSAVQCEPVCHEEIEKAKEEGRITNYGCVGNYPLDKPLPWRDYPGTHDEVLPGMCNCDNGLINYLAETVIDAMATIAQIGCYLLMSALKLVVDIGSDIFPEVGKPLQAGLDAAHSAVQTYKYVYDESEDPAGAFEWWLTPCGGSDLVPESIKKAFDILGSVTDAGSWRSPKNIKKGSGKRGDKINPRTRSPLPRGNRPGPSSGGQKPPNRNPNKPGNKKKCLIKLGKDLKRMGQSGVKNTVRSFSCDNDKTVTKDMVITSLKYGPAPTKVVKHCDKAYSQACFHYSSAISVSPQWSTLTCPPEAATTAYRLDASATKSWNAQHAHPAWIATDAPGRTWDKACDRDEYPPAYFLTENDPAFKYAGSKTPGGQLMRYLPNEWNQRAGQMWKGACFGSLVVKMSDQDVVGEVTRASKKRSKNIAVGHTEITALVDVDEHPEFSITWGQAGSHPVDDGLADNPCWPKIIAAGDPGGFALLNADPYVVNQGGPKYDYKKAP